MHITCSTGNTTERKERKNEGLQGGETYKGVYQLGMNRLDVQLVGLKQGLLLSRLVRFAREAGSRVIVSGLAELLSSSAHVMCVVAVEAQRNGSITAVCGKGAV